MENHLTGSIIIPTYNGAGKIGGLLNCLLEQSWKNVEIIVVIDGSTDDTEKVLENYLDRFRSFKIIKQQNGGRSVVRNNGARNASGEILIFYDDDMLPFPDSVAKHMSFHATRQGILCGHPIEPFEINNTDIQNYRAWISKAWTDKYENGINQLGIDNLFFTAASCSIPKALFWPLDGFDQQLTDGEDYDFAFRAIKQRIPVYFDKENKAVHNDKITCVSYIKRLRTYALQKEQWQRSNPQLPVKSRNYTVIKRMVYRAFAHSMWAQLIDKGFFISLLPTRLRYRLYSTIIQSLANEYVSVPL